jgi:hypothetical protein
MNRAGTSLAALSTPLGVDNDGSMTEKFQIYVSLFSGFRFRIRDRSTTRTTATAGGGLCVEINCRVRRDAKGWRKDSHVNRRRFF